MFDTVAALNTGVITRLVATAAVVIPAVSYVSLVSEWPGYIQFALLGLMFAALARYVVLFKSQYKYFLNDPDRRLRFVNPFDWYALWKHGHWAYWSKKNYDSWLDSDVGFARHALAIDENRKDFPRVEWATTGEVEKNAGKTPQWIEQVWFAGCHSDVGGSYPEPESRLSDIALDWMVAELKDCAPDMQIREEVLVRAPDPCGLQHAEIYMPCIIKIPLIGTIAKKWKLKPRGVFKEFRVHPSVLDRLQAPSVPQMGDVKPYRPPQLAEHPQAKSYFPKP